jgi:hypothetical protein
VQRQLLGKVGRSCLPQTRHPTGGEKVKAFGIVTSVSLFLALFVGGMCALFAWADPENGWAAWRVGIAIGTPTFAIVWLSGMWAFIAAGDF